MDPLLRNKPDHDIQITPKTQTADVVARSEEIWGCVYDVPSVEKCGEVCGSQVPGGPGSPSEEGTRTVQRLQSSTESPVLAGWGREMRKASSSHVSQTNQNLECRLRPREGAAMAR